MLLWLQKQVTVKMDKVNCPCACPESIENWTRLHYFLSLATVPKVTCLAPFSRNNTRLPENPDRPTHTPATTPTDLSRLYKNGGSCQNVITDENKCSFRVFKIVFWKVGVHMFPDQEVQKHLVTIQKVSGIAAERKTVTGQRVRENGV
jgi:hypothetical protein